MRRTSPGKAALGLGGLAWQRIWAWRLGFAADLGLAADNFVIQSSGGQCGGSAAVFFLFNNSRDMRVYKVGARA